MVFWLSTMGAQALVVSFFFFIIISFFLGLDCFIMSCFVSFVLNAGDLRLS